MTRTNTDPTIPSHQDTILAREASRELEQHGVDDANLRFQVGKAGREVKTLELPPAVVRLLKQLLQEMGKGHAVTVVPIETEITTQQAADLLNVSQPYLIEMIDRGELSVHLVDNQRRLPLIEVLEYKKENLARRLEALREMTAIDQELGLR